MYMVHDNVVTVCTRSNGLIEWDIKGSQIKYCMAESRSSHPLRKGSYSSELLVSQWSPSSRRLDHLLGIRDIHFRHQLELIYGAFIAMLHLVRLGSDTRNGCPPPNVTIKPMVGLPWTLERLPPRDQMRLICLGVQLINQWNCSLRNYLATFAHIRFHTRIVESFIIHLVSLQYPLKKQHEVALGVEATCSERTQEQINFLSKLWSTIVTDSRNTTLAPFIGSQVMRDWASEGSVWNYKSTSDARTHRASGPRRTGHSATIKAPLVARAFGSSLLVSAFRSISESYG